VHADQRAGGNSCKFYDFYSLKYASFHHFASIIGRGLI
jgi:hypothetical protein